MVAGVSSSPTGASTMRPFPSVLPYLVPLLAHLLQLHPPTLDYQYVGGDYRALNRVTVPDRYICRTSLPTSEVSQTWSEPSIRSPLNHSFWLI